LLSCTNGPLPWRELGGFVTLWWSLTDQCNNL
jgi:hypothetical protein